jgi:putative thioredoxin
MLAKEGRAAKDQLQSLQARLAADSADHQARYDLATALNAMGEREQAAEALLEIMRRARKWNEDAARLQLLKFFEAWGFDDPATGSRPPPAVRFAVQLNGGVSSATRRTCPRNSRSSR